MKGGGPVKQMKEKKKRKEKTPVSSSKNSDPGV